MSEKNAKDDSDNISSRPSPVLRRYSFRYPPPHTNLPEFELEPPLKPTWQGAKIVDKSLWFKCELGPLKVRLNPVVTIVSVLLILAFILWCTLAQERKFSRAGRKWGIQICIRDYNSLITVHYIRMIKQ